MTVAADGIEVTREPERLGPYQLVDRIGAGGMAEGWLAVKHIGARQKVFLKRILREHRSDPDYVEWFRREAAIVASLRHANIVLLLEADPYGRYLAFEFIGGCDLRQLLRSHPDHRLPVNITVFILAEVLKALSHAHGRTSGGAPAGVIHRDLDPSNVLISREGEVKVADFGVAAVIRCDGEAHTHVVGKNEFQSPEETRNEVSLDGRSDLFSLGVMGYLMLSGKLPYTGTKSQIARAIAAGKRQPLREVAPPEVPVALTEWIERLLSPNRDDRHPSAPECEHALYGACAPDPRLFRDLGRMATRARPHETIDPARLHSQAPHTAPASHPPEESPTVPNAEALSKTDSIAKLGGSSDSVDPPTIRAVALVEEGATAARRVRQRVRGFVALSCAALVGGGLVTLARMADGTGRHTSSRGAEAKAPVAAPPASAPPPTVGSTAPPASAAPALQTNVAASTDTLQTTPDPAPAPTGTLRVGTVPQSQVWVDGQLVGWAPIKDLRVPAGQHWVSIGCDGREDARTRRSVTVTEGHQRFVGF